MERFRIYYGDGSAYQGSSDEDAYAAPSTDVQIIAQGDSDSPRGWSLIFGKALHGYYCWRNGRWFITDDAGFWDYLLCLPGPKKVVFGRSMPRTVKFNEVMQRAKAEGLGDDKKD